MNSKLKLAGLLMGVVGLSACVTTGSSSTSASAAPAAAPAPSGPKIGPGMNERGEVVDSKKVESGFGEKIKGQGRLIFASSAGYAFGDMHLIWIIHNANEPGYR